MVRAQFFRELRSIAGATIDSDDLEAHAASVLHAKVPQPSHSEYCDEIACSRGGVSQSTECREACTQQWGGIDGGQVVGHGHQPAGLGNHRLGIATVLLNAGVTLVLAVDEIAVAAVLTVPTATAEEANTDSLPNGPTLNVFADSIDPTHRLVTRYPRPLDWQDSLDRRRI